MNEGILKNQSPKPHAADPWLRLTQRPPRALIFDMDGTIIDTRDCHMAAWRELVTSLAGEGLGEREYRIAHDGFGQTNQAIFEAWFGEDAARRDWQGLAARKEQFFRDLMRGQARPRPGLLELLDAADAAGLGVALATSAPRENAEFVLEELGLARRFGAVVASDPSLRSKPHPDIFLKAADLLGVDAADCIGFEDSTHGCASVLAAGMALAAIAACEEMIERLKEYTPRVSLDFVEPLEWIAPLLKESRREDIR